MEVAQGVAVTEHPAHSNAHSCLLSFCVDYRCTGRLSCTAGGGSALQLNAHLLVDKQMIVFFIYKQMCTVYCSFLTIVSARILHDHQDRYPLHPLLAHRVRTLHLLRPTLFLASDYCGSLCSRS
jgi:hypothetical protein